MPIFTLKRLAIASGVSVATVGFVINFFPGLTQPKRLHAHPSDSPLSKCFARLESNSEPPFRHSLVHALRKHQTPSTSLDVLVVGGGCVGAGVALDAVSRDCGLKVGLVETHDFGSGTSSRSTKMLHGGVRYLKDAVFGLDLSQFDLVVEAIRERGRALRNAPHLNIPLPVVVPCYSYFDALLIWAGMKLYDFIAAVQREGIAPSRLVSRQTFFECFPHLREKDEQGRYLRCGVLYYDGSMLDARLNLATVLTAARLGAITANYCTATSLLQEEGRVVGAIVCDNIAGDEFPVYSKVVVSATGPSSNAIQSMFQSVNESFHVVHSIGAHLTLPGPPRPPLEPPKEIRTPAGDVLLRGKLHPSSNPPMAPSIALKQPPGLLVPETSDGRLLFVLPWQADHWIAGTTDKGGSYSPGDLPPNATKEDSDFILESMASVLESDESNSTVKAAWAGIRPLVVNKQAHSSSTSSIVREAIINVQPGLVSIAGGKFTTYRQMAEDTVNVVLKSLEHESSSATSSPTAHLPLQGSPLLPGDRAAPSAEHAAAFRMLLRDIRGAVRVYGLVLEDDILRHLMRCYGSDAPLVVKMAGESSLKNRLVPGLPMIEAEIIFACRNQLAVSLTDVLSHRSSLAFLEPAKLLERSESDLSPLERAANLMASELGWGKVQVTKELQDAEKVIRGFIPL